MNKKERKTKRVERKERICRSEVIKRLIESIKSRATEWTARTNRKLRRSYKEKEKEETASWMKERDERVVRDVVTKAMRWFEVIKGQSKINEDLR